MTAKAGEDDTGRIRIIALGVMRRADGKMLLEKGHDAVKGETFYRPMGGGVEFGETGRAALTREFLEETGCAVEVADFLGTVENIFVYEGMPGHQLVLLYACSFRDPAHTQGTTVPRIDDDGAEACWRSFDEIRAEGARLYPEGIAGLVGADPLRAQRDLM